jgi:hypothetical protein
MPGLLQSLQGQDLGHMRIVAEQWGIALSARDGQDGISQLEAKLPDAVAGSWQSLSEPIRDALLALMANGGRLPWSAFVRRFGDLREFGPGRRDKEKPHLDPTSITEQLWYRGLIGRAFFDVSDGLVEHAYIPDELVAVLPWQTAGTQAFGRPARPEERAIVILAGDGIVDQACTYLAGLRAGTHEDKLATAEDWKLNLDEMRALLSAAGLLDDKGKPVPEATRRFLEAPRGVALAQLAQAWLESDEYNDLRLLPGLQAEGNWQNDPAATRRKLIDILRSAPADQWWNIASLIADVKARQPDFQRPAGDYDSWYLHNGAGQYLRGFAHWDEVDGGLIAHMLRVTLPALGILDLAAAAEGQPAAAFRWSRLAQALLQGKAPAGAKAETLKLRVDSRGKVLVPLLSQRAVRYLLARFCDWLPKQKDGYVYLISAAALEQARKQGLKVSQLLALLKANSSAPLPPNLLQALKRWEEQGTQARLQATLVLRLGSAAALKALRASKAARYLGEPLGPTAVVVKPGASQQVLGALLELGYLGELEEAAE